MKILIENSTNTVLYRGDHLELSDNGLTGDGFRASNIKTDRHSLINVESVPTDFFGGHYTHSNGNWVETKLKKDYDEKKMEEQVQITFIALKKDFMEYMNSHYDLGTQGTIRDAYAHPMSEQDIRNNAVEVLDWVNSVRRYYIEKKKSVKGGNVKTTWDFQQFDATKPIWDFEDFV